MDTPVIIRKVALVVCKDKKLLMVRSADQKDVFYMLGGTVEEGETDEECLVREVREEVSCELNKGSLIFLAEFEDEAHGRENTMVNMTIYLGELVGDPKVSSEIVEVKYFDSSVDKAKLSPIANNYIFPFLKSEQYIQ